MSLPWGPVTLVANTMTSQTIDQSAKWVVIENSSVFLDLGVSFYPNQPPTPVTFSGQPWSGVVQAGDAKRFLLPRDGLWRGVVWLYPLNVATQSAATGANSAYSRAYLTTFSEIEDPSDFHGIIRGLDLTSQPRVISLNPAVNIPDANRITCPSDPFAGASNWLTGPALTDLTALDGTSYGLNPTTQPFTHVYGFGIRAVPLTVGECTVEIYACFVAAGLPISFVQGNTFPLFRFTVASAGAFGPNMPYERSYVIPKEVGGASNAGATQIQLYFALRNGNGGMQIDIDVMVGLDRGNNHSFPLTQGGNSSFAGDLY